MSPPVTKRRYTAINQNLHTAYVSAASLSMSKAAQEVLLTDCVVPAEENKQATDCAVSVDGTWQKRGYSSRNGVVSVISKHNEKCVDYEVLSKHCKACEIWDKKKDSLEYPEWEEEHKESCQINHQKSSGSMESSGDVAIFNRSVQKHGLRY